jgi:hypothetical protein
MFDLGNSGGTRGELSPAWQKILAPFLLGNEVKSGFFT